MCGGYIVKKLLFLSCLLWAQSGSANEVDCEASLALDWQDASAVLITGDFNSWAASEDDGAVAMSRNDRGLWQANISIPQGSSAYKYIINGEQWVVDPQNPFTINDGFGGKNSVVKCQGLPIEKAQCGLPEKFDWRDTVMYFAMIDRFNDSDGQSSPVDGVTGYGRDYASAQYEGGDIKGVTEKISYLSEMGVSSLWLSAPYENRNYRGGSVKPKQDSNFYSAYHGYWPSPENIDYSDLENPKPQPKVEDRIGTADDLKELVATAHASDTANGSGMKVLLDYVMNHVDIASGLYQKHPNWFARGENNQLRLCEPEDLWNDPYWGTRCSFTDYLPALDLDNEDARRWSVNDALWWAKEFNIDGYRLDAIKHVPLNWLTDLRWNLKQQVKGKDQRFYLVGETFDYSNKDLLKKYVNPDTMLDGQFDFPFKDRMCRSLFKPDGKLSDFSYWLDQNDGFYDRSKRALMVNWVGNHDVPRAIHFASGQIANCIEGSSPSNGWGSYNFEQPQDSYPYEKLAMSFAMMMTGENIPLIYYGDEIGLAGGGDPDNRRFMIWDDNRLNEHQIKLRDTVKTLAKLRGSKKVMGRGNRHTYHVDSNRWTFRKGGCGAGFEDLTVVMNKADWRQAVPVLGGRYKDLITGDNVLGGQVFLEPRSFMILEKQ